MILDTQTKFSDAQLLTVSAISANVLDTRNAGSPALADEGVGNEVWLNIVVATTFTAAGGATLTASLLSDSATNLTTAPVTHFSTAAIPVATLVAGYQVARIQLPSADYKRYMGLNYAVATGPFTAGALSAFITLDPQRNVIYPSGFTVQ